MASGFQIWCQLALRWDIVLRAARVALLVGTILALINHGDHLIFDGLQTNNYIKILLTYLVPYGVSTYSSVQTVRHDQNRASDEV